MKVLIILLLTIVPFLSNAQSNTYLGGTVTPDYLGISITSEVEYKFILLSLQTNINSVDPTFKGMLGFQAGQSIKFVVFMPIMNLSLKELKYNTPFVAQLRYKPEILNTKFLCVFGGEFYKDTVLPYVTISIPFE